MTLFRKIAYCLRIENVQRTEVTHNHMKFHARELQLTNAPFSMLNAQCSMINIKRIDIFDGPLHTDLSIFSSKCNIFIAYPLTRNLINNYAEMTITNLGPNVNASQYDWNTADT